MLEERIEQDIKEALLGGDSFKATTLRTVKSVLLNLKVATGKRESGLSDDEVIGVLTKESKKRQESADLYRQGGDETRASAELTEKAIIDNYLPEQMSEDEVAKIVDEVIKETGATGQQDMGRVIGGVRNKTKGSADGALIARLVKEKLGL